MGSTLEPLTEDDPPSVGRFLIRARLGAGGMGRVYLASTEGGRPVAVKVMRSEIGLNPEFRERFRQEVEAARRVHGFYTAQVIDADPDAPQPWLATVYVPAPSLHQVVREHGALPEASVLQLMAGIGFDSPVPAVVQRDVDRHRESADWHRHPVDRRDHAPAGRKHRHLQLSVAGLFRNTHHH